MYMSYKNNCYCDVHLWSMHVMCFHPNGAYQNNKWKLIVLIKQTILSKIQMME